MPAHGAGEAGTFALWWAPSSLRSCSASDVRRGQMQHALQLERGQLRMLAQHEGAEAGDMGSREAVAGRVDRLAAEPGNVHVQAAGEELHRRAGVRVERERIGRL